MNGMAKVRLGNGRKIEKNFLYNITRIFSHNINNSPSYHVVVSKSDLFHAINACTKNNNRNLKKRGLIKEGKSRI